MRLVQILKHKIFGVHHRIMSFLMLGFFTQMHPLIFLRNLRLSARNLNWLRRECVMKDFVKSRVVFLPLWSFQPNVVWVKKQEAFYHRLLSTKIGEPYPWVVNWIRCQLHVFLYSPLFHMPMWSSFGHFIDEPNMNAGFLLQ